LGAATGAPSRLHLPRNLLEADVRIVVCLVLGLAVALPAFAHRMRVFTAVEGDEISGQAHYVPSGSPSEGTVRVMGPDGEVLHEDALAEAGTFRFPIPAHDDLVITVNTPDGHAASSRISADALPADEGEPDVAEPANAAATEEGTAAAADPDAVAAAVEQAIAPHINALRADLDEQAHQTRLRDIVGGIGYIAGILGVVMFLKARKT